jgi:hypothetical protein
MRGDFLLAYEKGNVGVFSSVEHFERGVPGWEGICFSISIA